MSFFNIVIMDRTAAFYSGPSFRFGGGFPIYSGARRQRGGTIFGAIKRLAMPAIKSLGKKVLRKGATEAIGLTRNVIGDAIAGKNVRSSVQDRAAKRLRSVAKYSADEGLDALENMIGSGKRRRRRRRRGPRKSLRKRKTRKAGRRKKRGAGKALF